MFSTYVYYVLAASLRESGATDNQCLELAWCLQELTGDPLVQQELARTQEEALSLFADCFFVRAGNYEEHRKLLQDMHPDTLRNSDTFKEAVTLVYARFAF